MRSRSQSSVKLVMIAALASLPSGSARLLAQQAATPTGAPSPASKSPGPTTAPDKRAAPAAKPAPSEENPFPEEQSEAAQKQVAEQDRADRKAADSGSVAVQPGDAPDTGSSSRDKLTGMDILGDHESRISNGAGGTVVDPKLSTQDLKVGQQYMGMGNYKGAYDRFKEAVTVNPANVDAVFYLAEAARKTAHLDESAENYRIYLDAQPDGSKAKAARKALEQLTGK